MSELKTIGDESNGRMKLNEDLAKRMNRETKARKLRAKVEARKDPEIIQKPVEEVEGEEDNSLFGKGKLDCMFLEDYPHVDNIVGDLHRIYSDCSPITEITFESGSNPYFVTAVNWILKRNDSIYRVATPSDIEIIRRDGLLDLSDKYVDTALVLRSGGNPNSLLAKYSMRQLKRINGGRVELPVVIPYSEIVLKPVTDGRTIFPHGLKFFLKDDVEIILAPILNGSGWENFSEIDYVTGLPKELDETADRDIWIGDSGLSKFLLSNDGNIDSTGEHFDLSDSRGRVVLVRDK